jgi:HlyD family secretion protein
LKHAPWYSTVRMDVGRPIAVGAIALTVGFGGFGAWAAVAPLEGAVIANGTVTALGRNKIVQHLEGGIIKDILVSEGDVVSAGQALVLMDPLHAETNRNRVRSEYYRLLALEARAEAERVNAAELILAESPLVDGNDPEFKKAVEGQLAEFVARLARHQAEIRILDQQTAALQEKIAGLEAQQDAVEVQLSLVDEELADAEQLLADMLISRPRVLELRRRQAELAGQAGQLGASIAEAKQLVAEKAQQVQRAATARVEEASTLLGETRSQKADLQEQLRAAEDALQRVALRAPVDGTVFDLTQHGTGAVLAAGQEVLEIVPAAADLIVEAHVRPQDVDQVSVGQEERLMFVGLDQRQTPPIPGTVTYLSADRMENQRTGENYYLARLAMSDAADLGFDLPQIGAGQPVEVYLTTGESTFLSYITDPLATTIRRGLRE